MARSRIQMVLTAAGPDDPAAPTPAPATPATGRFHALLCMQNTETGDKRIFQALSWRDLPLPLMATDVTSEFHEGAVLIGNFDRIELQGDEVHGWGSYLSAPTEDAARLIGLVQRGELRGISADIDDVEVQLLFPVDTEGEQAAEGDPFMEPVQELPREEYDGQTYEVLDMPQPIVRFREGRVMGATVVPFPALAECFIEAEGASELALVASAAPRLGRHGVTGAMLDTGAPITAAAGVAEAPARVDGPREAARTGWDFPAIPPRDWFQVPEAPGPMPLTILDSGQVFGHLAVWGECHVGMAGECVEPPASACNYARFHVGECPTDDGGRVAVGHLTFRTGHAAHHLGAQDTVSHYDHTGTVAADVRAVDGEYGIWLCGAMRSTLSSVDVREVLSAPPSGDWRRLGGDMELVGALCVNVPGFNEAPSRRQSLSASAAYRKDEGQIVTLIVSHPAPELPRALAASADLARWMGATDVGVSRATIDRIATTVGRGRKQRLAQLAARVHGGQ